MGLDVVHTRLLIYWPQILGMGWLATPLLMFGVTVWLWFFSWKRVCLKLDNTCYLHLIAWSGGGGALQLHIWAIVDLKCGLQTGELEVCSFVCVFSQYCRNWQVVWFSSVLWGKRWQICMIRPHPLFMSSNHTTLSINPELPTAP
jgi:hypothetical protein